MGRMMPELNSKSIREIIVDDFSRVIYEVKSDIILVATIRHTRKKPIP
jgi:plasmid stabilization system protein ParE